MAGKPLSVAALMQEGLRKMPPPSGIQLKNRYNVLRETSRSSSRTNGHGRVESPGKRRRPDESPELDRNLAFKAMENEEEKFVKAKEIVVRVKEALGAAKDQIPVPLADILNGIIEWMDISTGVQESTANVVVDSYNKVAGSPRKSRRPSPGQGRDSGATDGDGIDPRKKKFMQEVKDAERSTLLFKTNMGTVPVMNPDTMKKKFSLDLGAKAAAIEKRTDGRPSAEATAQLDDALAMVTRMEFFGKVTKKAFKKGKSGDLEDFYSIPVRLSFKDKDTREAADSRMRSLCGMGGTIPYHRTLRNVINTVVGEYKRRFPDNYIQVKVDTEKFQLKVSRREGARHESVWHNNIELVDLPEEVLDLSRGGPGPSSDRVETMDSDAARGPQV